MEWLIAGIASIFSVGVIGFMIVGILSATVGLDSKAVKVTIITSIVCCIILAVYIHGLLDFSSVTSGSSNYGSSEKRASHSCCICGDDAYSKYGNDYWCTKHYYMAKAADGDLSP